MSSRAMVRKATWRRVQMARGQEGVIAITGTITEGPSSERGKPVVMHIPASVVRSLLADVEAHPPVPEPPKDLGNKIAQEGYDRCFCGCKYWENDQCVDCGTHISRVKEAQF